MRRADELARAAAGAADAQEQDAARRSAAQDAATALAHDPRRRGPPRLGGVAGLPADRQGQLRAGPRLAGEAFARRDRAHPGAGSSSWPRHRLLHGAPTRCWRWPRAGARATTTRASAAAARSTIDDLIAPRQRSCCSDPGSAWVLFKLDGGLDHVLLDEAQDTNPAQWGIAAASDRGVLRRRRAARNGGRRRPDHLRGRRHRSRRSTASRAPMRAASAPGAARRLPRRWSTAGGGDFEQVAAERLLPLHRAGAGAGGCGLRRGRGAGAAWWRTAPSLRHCRTAPARPGWSSSGRCCDRRTRPTPTPWDVPEAPEAAADAEALLAERARRPHRRMVGHGDAAGARPRPSAPATSWCWCAAAPRFVHRLVRALKERDVPVGGVDRLVLVEQIAVAGPAGAVRRAAAAGGRPAPGRAAEVAAGRARRGRPVRLWRTAGAGSLLGAS